MSRNGSGTYNLPAGNPVVTGTTITTTWANTTLSDIASALTGSVSADGQTPMSGSLNMANNKITAVTDPTSAQDAATKAYVDLTQTASGITGGTITGATLTNDTIDSTPIGNTTRSTVKATTLDLGLSTQSVAIGQGNASIMKNRIINGAMVIDQRNAGASVTPTGAAYLVDRWEVIPSQSSKLSFQQNAGSVTTPSGFTNYLGATSLSAYSLVTSDYFLLTQKIEGFNISDLGWGTASGKSVTLSFQVYSSLTGTFGLVVGNGARTNVFPAAYSIPVANTWTPISIQIPAPPNGASFPLGNGIGIEIDFGLGVASNISASAGAWTTSGLGVTGATSVVGTSGATFYITGVQLEVGSSATGFEYRQYGQELALCQRYFEKTYAITTKPATVTDSLTTIGSFPGTYSTWFNFTFQASKRANPTMTSYSPSSGATGNMSLNMSSDVAIAGFISGGVNQACAYASYTGNASLYIHMTASSEL